MSVYVPARGKRPNRVMIVGERPGREEAAQGRPFVGPSGREQERYLKSEGYSSHLAYVTNLVKDFDEYRKPAPEEVRQWGPTLEAELAEVQPEVVLSVGSYATTWFLGDHELLDDGLTMDLVHGIPHKSKRCPEAVVMPCIHPAAGLYDGEVKTLIAYDYGRAVGAINGTISLEPAKDEFAGKEDYRDLTGAEFAQWLLPTKRELSWGRCVLAIDTEGYPDDTWSLQVSMQPGTGRTLRCAQPDFAHGVAALQELADLGCLFVLHNGMYDLEMCRVMGLDLFHARLWDTMYAAYVTRIEPQGLKALAYRWCGMRMGSYNDTIGAIAREKQLDYLERVFLHGWPAVEPRIKLGNDGTAKLYQPQAIDKRAESIFADWYSGKLDKDGNRTDVAKRWKQVDPIQRAMVEVGLCGALPRGSLNDLPLDEAVRYASRDPDATLRLYFQLAPALEAQGLTQLHRDGMGALPVFEEMQSNGIPANRKYFQQLSDDMWSEMCRIQSRISHRYFDDRPFNPASPKQVATLMRRRGLVGEKRTSTGLVSTSKKSIEHLRYTDPAISDVIDWREHEKIKDTFCAPVLERIPGSAQGNRPVRCTIKTTRVTTRRIATTDPNLLAIPARNELGLRVRKGYQAEEGQVFGAWDLSQIEMRYIAHLSRDPLLVELFNTGRDVHAETAARIFDVPLADVDAMEHRYPSKRAGFGIIYGIQGSGLLDQLRMFGLEGWTERSCDDLIKEWLKMYKGVRDFRDRTSGEVMQTGVVHDHWGMLRYLPGVWSDDRREIAEAQRMATSHKVQGGAQGMIQRSMAWLRPNVRALRDAGSRIKWLLQVHDELILQFDEDLWETLNELVIEGLTEHSQELIVPVLADGARAKTWGDLKG